VGAGYPQWVVDGSHELYELVQRGSPLLTSASEDLPAILGRPLTTIYEFAEKCHFVFLDNQNSQICQDLDKCDSMDVGNVGLSLQDNQTSDFDSISSTVDQSHKFSILEHGGTICQYVI
jgi:hypothetical protein